ncbi:DNA-binding response OmpR family regulator [Prescottella agglutinans]|uniref:DNA-binding response OmpR family regulator n=1 Tax=Prescottella agglutinans TaxID=1644129 RepID=A0ABT6MDP5_9NOCA|nr:DNA-binding response OmpR family regulator [Prescottella agglutinans]
MTIRDRGNQRKVLVVDDERTISDSIAARLRGEGYDVRIASDGPAAVAECEAFGPDLVVLDVMLPGFDGLEVCRRIQVSRAVPVLMLTARADETDMVIGLGVGADDYLSKPFSMRVLVARIAALLRRADRATESDVLVFGDVSIDLSARLVRSAGVEVHLTRTEFDLLAHLASRPRAAIARETLLAQVWGWGDAASSRTVDSHVKALRRKLGGDVIRTVHGVGYALEVPR